MTYEDFIYHFNQVYYCRLIPQSYKELVFKGKWDKSTSGGSQFCETFISNDQYQIYVNKKAYCIITLHQSDARLTGTVDPDYKYHPMAIWVSIEKGIPGKKKIDKDLFRSMKYVDGSTIFKFDRDSTIEIELEPSKDPYVLICCTQSPERYGNYHLRFSTDQEIEVKKVIKETDWEEIKFDGRWAFPLNGGCQYEKTWKDNPIYKVDVNKKTFLNITIGQPIDNSWNGIGVNVYSKEVSENNAKQLCVTFIRKSYWHTSITLDPNEGPYYLIPCCFDKGMNLPYTLRLFLEKKDDISVKCITSDIKIEDPIKDFKMPGTIKKSTHTVNQEFLNHLIGMGFDTVQVKEVLLETGNNLDLALDLLLNGASSDILECIKNKNCTYTVTKTDYRFQRSFRCVTCKLDDEGTTLCEKCINTCHKGHEVIDLKKSQTCFCDCPNSGKCKSFQKTKENSQ